MLRVNTSLSAIFSILCLLSFRFTEPVVPGADQPTELQEKNEIGQVCDNETFEYFYTSSERYGQLCDSIYTRVFDAGNRPAKQVFNYAMKGYANLMAQNMLAKKHILAFIDYSLSANKKRFWVIDLKNLKVLYHELVAHGRNTGEEFARKFSNKTNSFQSSLGFFVTGEIYNGKHELSVKMNGVERLYNGKAYDRGIVIHGADYVNEEYIRNNKRLGRSLGCPAVSETVIASLSETISNGACLFSYYPNKTYLRSSKMLNTDVVYASPAAKPADNLSALKQ